MQPHAKSRSAATLLLVAVALLGLTIEFGTRAFIYRTSAGLSRIDEEARAAAHLVAVPGGPRQVLLVGNSLLLHDIDMEALNRELGPQQWNAVRFSIPQTTYYDWYFGLKRLVAAGARPDAFVFCFEPRHIVQSSVRGEIFAHFLMRKRDIVDVGGALHMSLTDTADLYFANVSTFYALRKEIRKNLLMRFLPSLPELTNLITQTDHPPPSVDEVFQTGKARLIESREIAAEAAAPLLLLITPPVPADYVSAMTKMGAEAGVPVVAALDDSGLSADDYQADAYHLNDQGREKFTRLLAPKLAAALQGIAPSAAADR